jgi:hypothetical protein
MGFELQTHKQPAIYSQLLEPWPNQQFSIHHSESLLHDQDEGRSESKRYVWSCGGGGAACAAARRSVVGACRCRGSAGTAPARSGWRRYCAAIRVGAAAAATAAGVRQQGYSWGFLRHARQKHILSTSERAIASKKDLFSYLNVHTSAYKHGIFFVKKDLFSLNIRSISLLFVG